jgi:hypothetical protein
MRRSGVFFHALLVLVYASAVLTLHSASVDHLHSLPVLPVGLWNRAQDAQNVLSQRSHEHRRAQIPFSRPDIVNSYPAHTLQVPVDHFPGEDRYEPHSNATFPLRYWVDDRYYKPGGPVIVLDGGETSGADRIPFLDHGIVQKLAQATNGLGSIYSLFFIINDALVNFG